MGVLPFNCVLMYKVFWQNIIGWAAQRISPVCDSLAAHVSGL